MKNCEKLKWNRQSMGLSRKALGDMIGLSDETIRKLETDESTWEVIRPDTFDKISEVLNGERTIPMKTEQTKPVKTEEEYVKVEDPENAPAWALEAVQMYKDLITEQDKKTMVLLEFAYEGFKESKTHSEFIANIKLLKRMLKDY